ncbi:dienelactone hydrolase family protein [Streptomyces vinaceus]|uniref:hypothetical protein n=1 Tax=Streptomyces vinaceus TaxID=1960 RepID=UPI0038057D27
MPGISPDVLRFARWVRDAGFTVHVPSLFGTDGAFPTVEGGREVVRRACVSAEFRAFAGGGTSPVTVWLRGLARRAHTACGGPGVGAIGMCFTGNFALTMALEPAVIASVVNHPSLPLDDPGGLELDEADARAVRDRLDRDGLTVLPTVSRATAGARGSASPPTARCSATPSTGASCRTALPTRLRRPSSPTWSEPRTASSRPTSSTRPATRRSGPATRSSHSSPPACTRADTGARPPPDQAGAETCGQGRGTRRAGRGVAACGAAHAWSGRFIRASLAGASTAVMAVIRP